jgi:endonuclease/exonuclease/phosphatase family metal-dependent hydrolase
VRLAVLQWNLGNFDVALRPGGRGPGGMSYSHATPSRAEDLPHFAAVIKAERPDLATLQEVDVRAGHHLRLAELTGYRLAACGGARDRHTQALLAAPGVEVLETLSPPPGVNAVGAAVRAGGLTLSVFSNHSDAGILTASRAAQHRALAAWAAGRAPLLLGGDFNFDDAPGSLHAGAEALRAAVPFFPAVASSDWAADAAALAGLKAALADLGAQAGPTSGAPRHWPRILLPLGAPLIPAAWALGVGRRRSRLDYVFGAGLKASSSRVLRLAGPGAAGHGAVPAGAFEWLDHDPLLVAVSA